MKWVLNVKMKLQAPGIATGSTGSRNELLFVFIFFIWVLLLLLCLQKEKNKFNKSSNT